MSASRVGYNVARNTDTNATSITVSITGPVANNLLLAGICIRIGTTISTPAGWTLIQKGETSGDWNCSSALFYRIADGNETNVTITWATKYEAVAFVAQYSGLATSGVLDTSSDDETYLNTTGATGGFGTATPTNQPGLAVAVAAFLSGSSTPSRTWDSGFDSWFTSSGLIFDPYVALADRAYSSLSALSPSVAYSVAVKNYGALALFKEPSAPSPVTGSLAVTLGAVSASAAGTVTLSGAGALTLAGATVASSGAVGIAGASSFTLGSVGLSVAGAAAIAGGANNALGSLTLGGAGAVAVAGSSAVALADVGLSGSGAVGSSPISGALSVALSDVLAAASGAVTITGAAGLSLGAMEVSAAGAVAGGIDAPIGGKPRDPEIEPVPAHLALFDDRDLLETVPIIMGIINAARR